MQDHGLPTGTNNDVIAIGVTICIIARPMIGLLHGLPAGVVR